MRLSSTISSPVSKHYPYDGEDAIFNSADDERLKEKLASIPTQQDGAMTDFALIILSERDTALYNRIKYPSDVELGIRTICVVHNKFLEKQKNKQVKYFANVAVKCNLKCGGTNHTIGPELWELIKNDKTMLVGLDVTHPSPGSSMDGLVWLAWSPTSIDISDNGRRLLPVQEGRQEMVKDLSGMLKTRLRLWGHVHDDYPENIILYRDGVSKVQDAKVLQEEVSLLQNACEEMYPNKQVPRVSIVMVGKRHHTRFFP